MKDNVTYIVDIHFSKERQGGPEIVKAALVRSGFDETEIVESVVKKRPLLSFYYKNLSLAERTLKKIEALKLKGVKVKIRDLKVVQWRDKWKKDFKVFKLTEKFDVVPAWEMTKKRRAQRIPIYLDTGLAFGTGLHETTRFMVELIENSVAKLDRFFDIGTGTGILSIAAAKTGAVDIDAIDISKDAVKVAKQNLRVNGIKAAKIKAADIGQWPSGKKYDFVAANLITPDLIKFKRKILSFVKTEGYLALSGISIERLVELRNELKALPLKCLKVKKGEAWAAILFQRTKNAIKQ
jgi:ribosomal protein L11 methyltransferase